MRHVMRILCAMPVEVQIVWVVIGIIAVSVIVLSLGAPAILLISLFM